MAPGHTFAHPGQGSHPMFDQNTFSASQQQSAAMAMGVGGAVPANFYNSFSDFGHLAPNEAVGGAPRQGSQHPHIASSDMSASSQQMMFAFPGGAHEFMPPQQQMAMAGFGPVPGGLLYGRHLDSFLPFGAEDSSGEFDDSMGMDDESIIEMCEDPVMRERLRVVQRAQEAASSEGASGIFACPYCDKQYSGKHARSIWRRHLQDKHAIPLSQQPRRTRWDGDANRPKNAEERRQRMLESKRRWARKKRMMDKANASGSAGKRSGSADSDGDKDSDDEEDESHSTERDSAPPVEERTSKPVQAPARKRAACGSERKARGMQQLKFHHLTTTDMPQYVDANGGNHSSGAIRAVWTTVSAKGPNGGTSKTGYPSSSSSMASARNFTKHASMPAMPQQYTTSMLTSITSPRLALAEVDGNASNGRRIARTSSTANAFDTSAEKKTANQPTYDVNTLMPAPGAFDAPAKSTPLNRFSTLYPTPPSAGDDKSLAAQVFGVGRPSKGHDNGSGMLSPPASQHAMESSPSLFTSAGAVGKAIPSSVLQRHNASAMLSPVSSARRQPHSPAGNPFSLDQHKISPAASSRRLAGGMFEPPTSSSRLSNALDERDAPDENHLSPIQPRLGLVAGNDSVDQLLMNRGSPDTKKRKLPPLVRTPLRPIKLEDVPTPNNAMGLIASESGSASVRRLTRSTIATPAKKGTATTPTQQDRMQAVSTSIGLTPFDVRNGSKYSISRTGLFSRASPAKRETAGGDQFSSPQHLNLTQSLGLAPHSTAKGSSSITGMNSLTGTPYVHSFMTSNSPWPDSVFRPSFRMSASKRGGSNNSDEMDGHDDQSRHNKASSDVDDDEDDGQDGVNETPSRPARRPHPSLLGSPSASQQQRSAPRSQATNTNGGSSATRLRQSASSRRPSDLPPISFKLSSPVRAESDVFDDEEQTTSRITGRKSGVSQAASFDSELLNADSPITSHSSNASTGADVRDENSIELSI